MRFSFVVADRIIAADGQRPHPPNAVSAAAVKRSPEAPAGKPGWQLY